jgi:hypothetical protein
MRSDAVGGDLPEEIEAVELGGARTVEVLALDVGAHHAALDDLHR